jgi:hypothetical protein
VVLDAKRVAHAVIDDARRAAHLLLDPGALPHVVRRVLG